MKYLAILVSLLAALLFFMVTLFPTASAQQVPDVSLLTLTCDEASQAAAREGLHVTQCRHYGQDTIEDWKAIISVTVKTEQGKFIVTLHYYKSPWWGSGIEVVRA